MTATLAKPASGEGPIAIIARRIADQELQKVLPPLIARITELEAEVAALRSKKR